MNDAWSGGGARNAQCGHGKWPSVWWPHERRTFESGEDEWIQSWPLIALSIGIGACYELEHSALWIVRRVCLNHSE